MIRFLIYILLIVSTHCSAQIFRFSTIYASFSTSTPFTEDQEFTINSIVSTTTVNDFANGNLIETTQINEPNYNFTLGFRKIARFDYQVKGGRFFDGGENEMSDYATISNAPGLEYLLEYSSIRNRGESFAQQEYKVRYISNHFTTKASYVNDGLIDLQYTLGEVRFRKNLGNIDFTLGVAHRSHPVYGYSPIAEWAESSDNASWSALANSYGYFSTSGGSEDWLYVDFENGTTEWVADDDNEFYRYYFGNIVNRYNKEQLALLGMQQEVSGVIGVDYYNYSDSKWIHGWASLYPIHKGMTDYAYSYPNGKMEWDTGLILGVKLNKHFSIFAEGRHLKYWDMQSYEMKAGLNYLIF